MEVAVEAAAMMMAAAHGLAKAVSRWTPSSTAGTHQSLQHQPTHLVAATVNNMATADLKYYELYRRSRYYMRA